MQTPSFEADLHNVIVGKQDYFRYATLALSLRRIDEDHVSGALAEVGVFQGETSELLHAGTPVRRLYLFDTFEGFPDEHLETWQRGDTRFRDTSLGRVQARFPDTSRLVIRKGRVPDTLAGLEDERFAFVLLDLDLHEPTVRALEFFYPRLSPGGFLVVHDYNNPESDWACKRALDAFLADKPERLVEIADVWGSAFVRKA